MIMYACELRQSQPDDGEPDPAAYGHRPTPISLAVRTFLASFERRPFDAEWMLYTGQFLSCIQNLRLHMQLLDDQLFEATSLGQLDKHQTRQDASSLQRAALRLADEMQSRLSLIRNLSSTPQRGKGKA